MFSVNCIRQAGKFKNLIKEVEGNKCHTLKYVVHHDGGDVFWFPVIIPHSVFSLSPQPSPDKDTRSGCQNNKKSPTDARMLRDSDRMDGTLSPFVVPSVASVQTLMLNKGVSFTEAAVRLPRLLQKGLPNSTAENCTDVTLAEQMDSSLYLLL